MTETTDDLDRSAGDMMPSPGEIALRLRYLELGADDLALLRRIHPLLQPRLEPVIEAFYTHLLSMPVLRPLLGDGAALARLRRVQAGYFRSLTAGDYGDDYVRNRLRVGLVHQRIGLAPVWYLGGYRKYLTDLAPVLRELLRDSPDTFLPTYGALFKVVNFDMSLALDTYIQAGRRKLLGLKNYSEQIISSMPSGVMVVDGGGAVRTVNQAMLGMLGGQRGGAGLRYDELVGDAALRACIAEGLDQPAYQRELTVTLPDGPRHLRCCLSRTLLDKQDLLLLIAEDITAPMQARAELRDSEERYRAAFGQAAVGLAEVSADGSWLRVNRKLLDIVGYSEDELLRLRLSDIVSPEDWQIDAPLLRSLAAGALQSSSREKRYLCKDGRAVWVKATVAAMRPAGDQASLVAVIEDISQRKQFEEELLHLASHDALTGLANRTLLLDRIGQAIAQARRSGRQAALLFLDLDRFKTINDSLGHDAGDRVVVEVGRRLQQAVREADTVARLGGDEFVVLLADLPHERAAGALAQKILEALFAPMLILGHELSPASSIGISMYPKDGADGKTLLKNADAAMYQAKALGRGNYQFYSHEMNARTLDRLTLESGLRHAVERGELQLMYQPQIDLGSGIVVGVEALLRWHPAGEQLVMPDAFIPIAEETGLIVPIGEWVLRTACAQHVAWRRAGLRDVRIAVNLSARQFRQPGLDAMVARVLADTGCHARCLELEITETVLMERPDSAAQTLQRLSDMGVQLAIDDFGTGYSSLSYLKRFPIHALKIDRSFVRDIPDDADDAAIAGAVIALAHSMGLTVVAEGVETPQQRDFLRGQRCDQAQGYYFSEPVTAVALARMLGDDAPLAPAGHHPLSGA
ncbi:EAL domain-containing protein [Duganella hordei]|uniref:EAL domain-containing protein n=1 Tax=Duganella hordei TaxID=2865934 RepID=UPI0030E8600A